MKDIASKWKAESLMVKDHQKQLALAHVRAHLRSQECSAYLHTSSLICKAGPDYIESFQKLTTEDRKWVVSMLLEEGLVTRCDEVKGYRLKVRPSKKNGLTTQINRGMPVIKKLYLITNPAFPGWVKVGETTGKVEDRASSMRTGTPTDYVVEREMFLPDGLSDKDVHPWVEMVAGARVREWFFMDVELAEFVVLRYFNKKTDEIKAMPRCEPPSVMRTVRSRFGDFIKFRQTQQQQEALYDADFLAFS